MDSIYISLTDLQPQLSIVQRIRIENENFYTSAADSVHHYVTSI